ncbi:MAG: hypothetical protein QM756_08155 [Polyangiaceae bacterium]
MLKRSSLRIALGSDGVSVWCSDILGDVESPRLREFLSRAFSVPAVRSVELQPHKFFGRIEYESLGNPAEVLRSLGKALSATQRSLISKRGADDADPKELYLSPEVGKRLRVTRVGNVLSTWHVRQQSEGSVRLAHPLLRRRGDVVFRLEEELAALLGINEFRTNVVSGSVSIHFDARILTVPRLLARLEQARPRLLNGIAAPPSPTRLVAAVGLTGLAYTGQYVVPAVRPLAVAAVAIYSAPNVVNAGRQLARGEVGISALYSTGLAFMLFTGMPFTAATMATLMQLWPHLARKKVLSSQRRLFARQRRRPSNARIVSKHGKERDVDVSELRDGDRVVVRGGQLIPVDGVVEDGVAVVLHGAAYAQSPAEDRVVGDVVAAGGLVRDGALIVRVERAGAETSASYVDSLLPHGYFQTLDSSVEAERIANRNAKPTLAVAALNLALSGMLPPSQAVIRPDYATAPRLSAQMSAFRGFARAFRSGILLKAPEALDRLAGIEAYVIDETAGFEQRQLELASLDTVDGVSRELALSYALRAVDGSASEQARALSRAAAGSVVAATAESVRHAPGVRRYLDEAGTVIELATNFYVTASKIGIPNRLAKALKGQRDKATPREAAVRPLWLLRGGKVVASITFARSGELVGKEVVAALAKLPGEPQVTYLSGSGRREHLTLASTLGAHFFHAATPEAKLDYVRSIGRDSLWIGDGAQAKERQAVVASAVSVSVAPLERARDDAAHVLIPQRGCLGLLDLIAIGRAHGRRLAQDYGLVYAANLSGAGAGLLANWTALRSGLLSNLATAAVYTRHAAELERLVSAVEHDQAASGY